uniref:Orf c05012 protein n=1 Tax=Saccharolobus solfataricus TaxID=2287 RepID=P96001_SACSO|nr:orf c05012 [Saccharolobus solfataricus P2]
MTFINTLKNNKDIYKDGVREGGGSRQSLLPARRNAGTSNSYPMVSPICRSQWSDEACPAGLGGHGLSLRRERKYHDSWGNRRGPEGSSRAWTPAFAGQQPE